jgi:tetratricopeptide (TPR) repeat protein
MCLALACGGGGGADRAPVKVPITTASAEARSAYLEGRELQESLRLIDAHAHFVRATELDPGFALAWMAVANTAPSAVELFAAMRRAVATAGGASDGEKMLITAFEAAVNGEPVVQRAELEKLVAGYPDDERAHNALATFLLGQQRYGEAAEAYRAAIAIDPGYPTPYNQLGYALRFLGDFDGAEQAFERYIELIPDQPNPYDSYAELLMRVGRFEDSIASYEKALEIDPTFVPSSIGIANNLVFLDRPAEALQTLDRLGTVARSHAERRQRLTWIAAVHLHEGDIEGALAAIGERFELAEAAGDRAAMGFDLNAMGDILRHAGRLDEAEARYRESVEMITSSEATDDVKEAAARNLIWERARTALERGETTIAAGLAADYASATKAHGIHLELQQARELAARVALATGEPRKALFELAHANQQDPEVLLLNARAFAAAGDHEAARAACRQVVEFNQLNPNLAFARPIARRMLPEL